MKRAILALIISTLIITPLSSSAFTQYRFNAKPLDTESNLYYYGQRYYNPNAGQFTQPDPVANYLTNPEKLKQTTGMDLQEFLENPQNLNTYSYALNNPVKYVDPDGEFAWVPAAVFAIGAAFTAWDIHDAYKTFDSTQATLREKAFNYGSLSLDFIPFAGITKNFTKFGSKAFDASKIVERLATKLDKNVAERIAGKSEDGFITFYRGTNNITRNFIEGIKSQNLHFTDIFSLAIDYAWHWDPIIDPGVASFKLGIDQFISYVEKGLIIPDPKDINGFRVISSEIREQIINLIKK